MSTFEDYARWYDLLYLDKDYEGEAAFVDAWLRKEVPSSERLLDLGAGTGAHALAMAARCWQVVGVDLSGNMIRRAEQRVASHPELAARVSFRKGDVRSFTPPGAFDAVTALFHVASYQTTPADLSQMMATARLALRPGGIFLFDYWYGAAVLAQGVETRVKSVEGEGIRATRIAQSTHEEADAIVRVNYTLFCEDLVGNSIRRIDELHVMRYWFPFEVEALLVNNGFSGVCHFAWLTVDPPTSKTWAAYTVATAV